MRKGDAWQYRGISGGLRNSVFFNHCHGALVRAARSSPGRSTERYLPWRGKTARPSLGAPDMARLVTFAPTTQASCSRNAPVRTAETRAGAFPAGWGSFSTPTAAAASHGGNRDDGGPVDLVALAEDPAYRHGVLYYSQLVQHR